MYFPKLKAQAQQRAAVEQFGGLDRRVGHGVGCAENMENMWSGGYPALETRPRRGVMRQLTKPHGIVEKDGLFWVDGTALYVNGAKTELVLSDSDKQLVSMGAYLLIFPDKKYINTQKLTEYGSMENIQTSTGEVTFTLCYENGESVGSYVTGTYAPKEPGTGDLWMDTDRRVTVMRTIPEMDFVVEQGNRLWGCKYGIVDGQAVNEVYACALGDFRNWNSFAGLSTDSYAAARGSDGAFTGAAACMGGVMFFKENCMERIYPAAGGGHQIVTVPCSGVRRGAERTVAVSDGVVYYLGNDGVYAFDGSMPVCVSRALGDKRYIGGVGGGESGRYWLAAKEAAGTTELLVYDTQRKLWHRQDTVEVMDFVRQDGVMLLLCRDGRLLDTAGEVGTKETNVVWSAESGDLGLYTPEHKYLARLELRMKLEEGAVVKAFVRYDNGETWEQVGTVTGTAEQTRGAVMQLRPRRCGHLRLKLMGLGRCRVYSAAAVYEKGSDVE